MIRILRKRIVETNEKESRGYYELVCDDFDDLPDPNNFDNWTIDMGSIAHVVNTGETYMLNSSGDWKPQKKTNEEGVTFTEDDKAKLDSLTNPILLKDRVENFDELKNIKDPQVGWLYFVGAEDSKNFAEYIYTDKKRWEYIGDNSIDLNNYVQKTDYPINGGENAGVVKIARSYGLNITANGRLEISPATNDEINNENSQYKSLVPSSIPIFMSNYSITKTTIQNILDRLAALENGGSK